MDMYSLLVIALALALDAFGVALSIGINEGIKFKNKLWFSMSFGFFQFLFSFLGAVAGFLFNTYILALPKIVGGIIIAVVGVLMLKEGLEEKEENILLEIKMYFILGISVNIDAAVIGFTVFNNITNNLILFQYTLFIGLISFIMSGLAFLISRYLRKIKVVAQYADYVGGIILFLFGIKMILF
jgi:putative Mn2+ efflux pump MntP